MPLYVDRDHLERATQLLKWANALLRVWELKHPEDTEMKVCSGEIEKVLKSTSHATDYMTQPVADYVPTATTITEAAAPAGPTNTAPKEG